MQLGIFFAAASTVTGSGDGAWMSAGFVKALGAAISAVLGAIGYKVFSRKVKVEPDPMHIEQSNEQVKWKDNCHDHENIFNRLSKLEKTVAALDERSNAQAKTLDRMASQVEKLYDRIILGGKTK